MAPNVHKLSSYCDTCNLYKNCCVCIKIRAIENEQDQPEPNEQQQEEQNQQRIEEQNRRINERRQRQIEEFRIEIQNRLDEFNSYRVKKIEEISLKKDQIKKEYEQISTEKQTFVTMKENILVMIEKETTPELKSRSECVIEKINDAISKKEEILTNLVSQEENCDYIEKLINQKYETLKEEYEQQFEQFKQQILGTPQN
jgi:hypothetical protein